MTDKPTADEARLLAEQILRQVELKQDDIGIEPWERRNLKNFFAAALQSALARAEATEKALEAFRTFHDAWVNAEVANATGNPDLVKKMRAELIEAHKAARALSAAGGQ